MSRPLVLPRVRFLALAVAVAVLALVAQQLSGIGQGSINAGAAAGVHITMTVNGQKTGPFKGDDNPIARAAANLITVLAYQYELVSPRDPASGQASGKRQHKPVTITHVMGGSSPEFLNSEATNENLKTVVINFFRVDRKGKEINYYRVTLTDASISDVRQYTSGADVLEDVQFTFRKIEQDDFIAKTNFLDRWASSIS